MRVAAGVHGGVEAHQVQQLVNASAHAGAVPAEQPGHRSDVVGDLEMREKAGLLDHVARLAAQLDTVEGADVPPVDQYPAAGGFDEPVDHAQHGGLAPP